MLTPFVVPIDINRRLSEDLVHPERSLTTVEALLGLGFGPFDTLGWTFYEWGMDEPDIHDHSLWKWLLDTGHVSPALERLSEVIEKKIVEAGPLGAAMVFNHWMNDVWGVRHLLRKQHAPVDLIAWCLRESIKHTRKAMGNLPQSEVQLQVPLSNDMKAGPFVPEWDDAISRFMAQILMGWAFTKYPCSGPVQQPIPFALLKACTLAGVPPVVWERSWQQPILEGESFPSHAKHAAPFLLHLAKSEHWAAVNYLMSLVNNPWAVTVIERAGKAPLHDHLAGIALRQAILRNPGHDPDRITVNIFNVLERFFEDARYGLRSSQPLIESMGQSVADWLMERSTSPDGLSPEQRSLMSAYERYKLVIPGSDLLPAPVRSRL